MKRNSPGHNIEGVFVLLLFAVFAIAVVAVLALGADRYKNLVKRDDDAYNRRVITSYITARIRANDTYDAVETGGFKKAGEKDGIDTLHLYQSIDGEVFDLRIYCYDGYLYELFTIADNEIEPEAGNPIIEAEKLSFEQEGKRIRISATDTAGRENYAVVSFRSGEVPA